MNPEDAPSGFWYGRGRQSAGGPWHIVKLLMLDEWTGEAFCGAPLMRIARAIPRKARACQDCIGAVKR